MDFWCLNAGSAKIAQHMSRIRIRYSSQYVVLLPCWRRNFLNSTPWVVIRFAIYDDLWWFTIIHDLWFMCFGCSSWQDTNLEQDSGHRHGMTWRHTISPLAGGSSTWSGHRVAKAKSLEVVRVVVQVRIEASMAYSDIVLEFLESCCMLLDHRKSLTSKLEGSWKAASGTAGFSWESILYNAVTFWKAKKPYWAILLYLVTWCWTVPLSRLHAEKMLLLVDCLPGCVFVARRCAKHSKGALACQRRYVSNTKGEMCQSVIVVSYYMSPSHHVILCRNCMQRWQTSTMLLAAVFLTPCTQYVAWICQGFGSWVQPTWPLDLDTQTTKWLQETSKNDKAFVIVWNVCGFGGCCKLRNRDLRSSLHEWVLQRWDCLEDRRTRPGSYYFVWFVVLPRFFA